MSVELSTASTARRTRRSWCSPTRSAPRCEMWDAQAPALARALPACCATTPRPRRLARSRPARTRSTTSARDLLALLDRLEIERVSFCGLSIGGMIGMWLARRRARADRAAGAVLHLGRTCRRADLWSERAAPVRAEGMGPMADAASSAGSPRRSRRAHPEAVERSAPMLLATAAEGYAGCCEAIARPRPARPARRGSRRPRW